MLNKLGKYKLIIIASVVVSLVAILVASFLGQEEENPTAQASPSDNVVPVEVVDAKLGTISNYVTVSGEVNAIKSVMISPQAQGEVTEVAVEVGDKVEQGDKLITLDQDLALNKLRQAKAGVQAAKANLQKALKGAREEELRKLEAQLEQAKGAYEQAKNTYQRQQKLYQEDIISKQTLEKVKSQYIGARSGYESAKQGLKLAQKGAAQEDIQALKAQVEQAQAGLEAARLSLEKTTIESPIAGVVSMVDIRAGEVAAMQPVVAVANLDQMKVMTYVSENVVNKLEVGQEVDINIGAINDSYTGKIKSIGPVANRQQKKFPVEVVVDNQDNIIKSGMYAEIDLTTDKAKEEIVVLQTAILDDGSKEYVYVVVGEEVVKRKVQVSLSNRERAVITHGLKLGDQVVVKGQEQIEMGTKVKVVSRGDR